MRKERVPYGSLSVGGLLVEIPVAHSRAVRPGTGIPGTATTHGNTVLRGLVGINIGKPDTEGGVFRPANRVIRWRKEIGGRGPFFQR